MSVCSSHTRHKYTYIHAHIHTYIHTYTHTYAEGSQRRCQCCALSVQLVSVCASHSMQSQLRALLQLSSWPHMQGACTCLICVYIYITTHIMCVYVCECVSMQNRWHMVTCFGVYTQTYADRTHAHKVHTYAYIHTYIHTYI